LGGRGFGRGESAGEGAKTTRSVSFKQFWMNGKVMEKGEKNKLRLLTK
jgi:hypothetical protein